MERKRTRRFNLRQQPQIINKNVSQLGGLQVLVISSRSKSTDEVVTLTIPIHWHCRCRNSRPGPGYNKKDRCKRAGSFVMSWWNHKCLRYETRISRCELLRPRRWKFAHNTPKNTRIHNKTFMSHSWCKSRMTVSEIRAIEKPSVALKPA